MMNEKTKKEIEKLAKEFKGMALEWEEWEWIIERKADICFNTFKKYVKLEKEIVYEEKTIEEIIDFLNSLAGEDCWEGNWEYKVINRKPYKIVKKYKWN